jgi:phosphoglycolate phosphatase-like HAD superfamily hydrolase
VLRLITDFDGPVMDVSERYYRVYRHCLERLSDPNGPPLRVLSKAEFWDYKRAQVPERKIGQISGLDEARSLEFARLRRETVHTLPYLIHDAPVPGAVAALDRVQALGWDLVVMTMRRVRELDDAFNRCDLGRFFPATSRYCLADDYVKTRDVDDKPRLMARAIGELPPAAATWMVGDTEADIAAARAGGIPIIGVLSGIRDRDRLAAHQPDAIVDNLEAAIEFILARMAVGEGLPQTATSPV